MKETKGYLKTEADRLYDEMREEKIYIHKGMDSYTEFVEGVPIVRRALVNSNDPTSLTLDEWAARYNTDTSPVISLLKEATNVWQRAEIVAREMKSMREYYMDQNWASAERFTSRGLNGEVG